MKRIVMAALAALSVSTISGALLFIAISWLSWILRVYRENFADNMTPIYIAFISGICFMVAFYFLSRTS